MRLEVAELDAQTRRWQMIAQRAARDALLEPVRRELTQRNLAPILIKGDALSRTIYREDPERRPHVDVDWLAPQDSPAHDQALATISDVLVGHGWQPVPDSPKNWVRRGAIEVRVDLHSQLWFIPEAERLAFDDRCTPLADVAPFRAPDPNDHFIIVALHAVLGHAQFRPTWTEDLRRLLDAGTDLDTIVERSRRWGVQSPIRLAFEHLASLHDVNTPTLDEPRHWFERFREEFVRDLLARAETPDVGHILRWLHLPRRARLAALTRHLIPEPSFLESRYVSHSAKRARWLRPIRTVAAGLRLGGRLASR